MISGAEIDTRRRSLGLSVGEMADVIGVSERTISYWVRGDGEPHDPDGVIARLMDVEIAMGDLVDSICDRINDLAMAADVSLTRFRTQRTLEEDGDDRGLPLGAHAMAIAWAAEELRAEGHQVSIVWAS